MRHLFCVIKCVTIYEDAKNDSLIKTKIVFLFKKIYAS